MQYSGLKFCNKNSFLHWIHEQLLSFDLENALLHCFNEQLSCASLSFVFTRSTPVSEYQVSCLRVATHGAGVKQTNKSDLKIAQLFKSRISFEVYIVVWLLDHMSNGCKRYTQWTIDMMDQLSNRALVRLVLWKFVGAQHVSEQVCLPPHHNYCVMF